MRLRLSLGSVVVVAAASCFSSFNKVDETGSGGSAATSSTASAGMGGVGGVSGPGASGPGGSGPGGAAPGGSGPGGSGPGGTGPGGTGPGGGGGGGGDQGGGGASNCMPLSHNFDNNSLAGWTMGPDQTGANHSVVNGEVYVVANTTAMYSWFEDFYGWFVYQLACGDFGVRVSVDVASATTMMGVPGGDFNSGGLVMRNASSIAGDEFWTMVSMGRQNSVVMIGAEHKYTQHSMSQRTFDDLSTSPLRGEVAICRFGDNIRLSARADTGTWQELVTYGPGMPVMDFILEDDVQIGMVVNTWSNPDVEVYFDDFVTWAPTSLGDCTPTN